MVRVFGIILLLLPLLKSGKGISFGEWGWCHIVATAESGQYKGDYCTTNANPYKGDYCTTNANPYKSDHYTILFWNVENYFAPSEELSISWNRFKRKRDQLVTTILGLDSEPPAIIGLAEVESRFVLNRLIWDTPLRYGNYRVVHYDSPDRRGIDVALLYRKEFFTPLHSRAISVELEEGYFSRDILYVKGVLEQLDTLHLFVNHWPSKFGGDKLSTPNREVALSILKEVCDSLLNSNSNANIVVMGDFNEVAESSLFIPLTPLLHLEMGERHDNRERYNSREKRNNLKVKGTIKYQGIWEAFDHFFISKNLLDTLEPISIVKDSSFIYSNRELLERDRKYGGLKPFRTFIGPRYNGGVSDHLPIVTKIRRNW